MICPQCGSDTLDRVELPDKKYHFRCRRCGTTRGELKPDSHRGVT